MTRAGGVDLNGFWDWGDILRSALDGPNPTHRRIDGGINGAVISLGHSGAFVGGRQTETAPHGRGNGWGPLGSPDRRLFVRDLVDLASSQGASLSTSNQKALAAAVSALAPNEEDLAMCIPDVAAFSEARRQNLLDALRRSSKGRPHLIWRPIAAILAFLAEREARQIEPGATIAVVSLLGGTTVIGEARTAPDPNDPTGTPIPERRRTGAAIFPEYGGRAVVDLWSRALGQAMGLPPDQILRGLQAPWRLAAGQAVDEPAMRIKNGSWLRVPDQHDAPEMPPLPECEPEALSLAAAADIILVEGPFSQNAIWRASVLRSLGLLDDDRVRVLPPSAAAVGSCIAALRLHQGKAPYLDFLPQLEVNALVDRRAAFVNLIPKGASAQGGKAYVGKAPGDFRLAKGAQQITLFLIKEDQPAARRAIVELPEPSDDQHQVVVGVRQTPGQGLARVEISSPTFRPLRDAPLALDWGEMTEDERPRADLLADLQDADSTAYPDVQGLRGHPYHWHPDHPKGPLSELLQAYANTPVGAPNGGYQGARLLVQALKARAAAPAVPSYVARHVRADSDDRGLYWFVSAAGVVPAALDGFPMPDSAQHDLYRALTKAEQDLFAIASTWDPDLKNVAANELVSFMTWCQGACPRGVVALLLSVARGQRPAPLNQKLVIHGLGRSVREADEITGFYDYIREKLDALRMNDRDYAAIGMILSRRERAAELLDADLAQALSLEIIELFKHENEKDKSAAYKQLFTYALMMTACLLRYRKVDPNFLLPEKHVTGLEIKRAVEAARSRIPHIVADIESTLPRLRHTKKQKEYRRAKSLRARIPIAEDLLKYLDAEGENPNIMRWLQELDHDLREA